MPSPAALAVLRAVPLDVPGCEGWEDPAGGAWLSAHPVVLASAK